jgi:hypothetical protein
MKTLSIKLLVIICLACGSVFAQTNDELAEQSIVAIRSQKLDEALQICKKVLESEPKHPKGNYACGAASNWLKNFADAEKYLVEAEKTIKDKSQLYTFLGAAYYMNRAKDKSLADFNTSLNYFAKAIKLDPKLEFSYQYRWSTYFRFYGESGLKTNPQLKEAFYSNFRQLILLSPKNEGYLYDYAMRSVQLGDFGQALPVFAKFVDSPNVNLEYVGNVCKNIRNYVNRASELPSGEDNPAARDNLKLWNDAILFAKSCKNAYARLETDETVKKQKVSEFHAETIFYRIRRGEKNKADYLASPEYLADLTEAIDAGDTQYYDKRIEVYTFLKQFAKADADKKSKVIAEETKQIDKLIAEEKRLRQEENDFGKKNANGNGDLSADDFKAQLVMKKSRLTLLDKIIALNLPQKDKDAFSERRNQLADVIQKADATVAANASRKEEINRERNRDAASIASFEKEANEALALYQKASQRSRSVADCRFLVDSYIKKCEIEKLELNIRDITNSLYYLRKARQATDSIANDETKRKYLEQADKMIKTVEDGLRVTEDDLRKIQAIK